MPLMPLSALPLLALLLGCPRTPIGPMRSPEELFLMAQAPIPDTAVAARFDMSVSTPTARGPASGTLLLDPPDRFYLEVRPPLGGAALVAASDGKVISAFVTGSQTLYTHPDAEEGLKGLTGGVLGLSAVIRLLAGRLPVEGAPLAMEQAPDGLALRWEGPGGSAVLATLDGRMGWLLKMVATDAKGEIALRMDYEPGLIYPKGMGMEFPGLKTGAELSFGEWKPASVPDARYQIQVPPGAKIMDLQQMLGEGELGEGGEGGE